MGLFSYKAPAQLLNEMRKQVSKQFAPDHHLYADRTMIDQAVRNLTKGCSAKGRRAMTAFAECCFQRIVNGRSLALPDLGWLEVTMDGNFPFGGPARVMAPAHVEVRQTEDALAFGNQVRVAGASTAPEELLRTLHIGASLFC